MINISDLIIGMFLYVKVMFRIIYYINDIEDIQNQLEHLPTSLEDAYVLAFYGCWYTNIT